jgi:hypothetical protein
VSERVTAELRRWWDDPLDLTFTVRLAGNTDYQRTVNSYALATEITDPSGLALHGSGLLWFVSFLIHLLQIADHGRPVLLLLDEPATPLHPKLQRVVPKLLDSISSQNQVIYSTHSPFMIDWNFPQRIRLFQRDYVTKRTTIENKPYRTGRLIARIWDPIMATIGVTLGDIAIIGEQNIIVEGVSDQLFIANASVALGRMGRTNLDLVRTSIIPAGEEPVVEQLVATARSRGTTAVVLCDRDEQGKKLRKLCERARVPYVAWDIRPAGDCSIEDLIGPTAYVQAVNAFYRQFDWFTALDAAAVEREQGDLSLGNYLERVFRERFGQSFSKVAVMVYLVEDIDQLPEVVLQRSEELIRALLGAGGRGAG